MVPTVRCHRQCSTPSRRQRTMVGPATQARSRQWRKPTSRRQAGRGGNGQTPAEPMPAGHRALRPCPARHEAAAEQRHRHRREVPGGHPRGPEDREGDRVGVALCSGRANGGIGSGKSTVDRLIERRGAAVSMPSPRGKRGEGNRVGEWSSLRTGRRHDGGRPRRSALRCGSSPIGPERRPSKPSEPGVARRSGSGRCHRATEGCRRVTPLLVELGLARLRVVVVVTASPSEGSQGRSIVASHRGSAEGGRLSDDEQRMDGRGRLTTTMARCGSRQQAGQAGVISRTAPASVHWLSSGRALPRDLLDAEKPRALSIRLATCS